MSFFGFDTKLPSGRGQRDSSQDKPLDFEDTYQGLGEHQQEEDDYLNTETFGDGADIGNDFDFSYGRSGVESAVPAGAENVHYANQNKSYASAAAAGVSPHAIDEAMELKPMESLWSNQPLPPQVQQQHPQQRQVLSMEELERQQQQMAMNPQQQQFVGIPPQGIPPQGIPPPGYGFPPNPNGFMQQPHQFQNNGCPPHPNFPQGMPPQGMPPQGMPVPPFQQLPMMYNQQQQQQQSPSQPQQGTLPPQQQQPQQQPQQQQQHFGGIPPQMQQQPVSSPQQQQPQISRNTASPQPPQVVSPPHTPRDYSSRNGRRGSAINRRPHEPLSEEEQKRLQIRQAKVDKILRHSGVMTPRDKDFITRYQLSQIVTDDPYNEDFYFQVYKIIQRGGVVGESNKGLIARAYLEHSGHRLGGRYKRADVALQRMQSQVEKAVTVAKERPQKNKDAFDGAKEGVLGKISSTMNSKAPRRQLQIPTHRENEEDFAESPSASDVLDEVTQSLEGVDINVKSKARRRSSYALRSIDQSAVLSRSGGRKFVLSLIEKVYEEVLELEAQLRSGKTIDNSKLWEALHIGDESFEVSPFISILSFDKGVKIMPRIFNFLDKAQKLQLFSVFFNELSHLNIIVTGSYKTNPSPTDSQLKKIELFQSVFLKIIVSFLSNSAEFIEVMSLLLCLIKNNNVSFITTSKIGLNLITVLISRAALIKQDINRGNVLSSPEISTWNEVYDKLFTSLETKLASVFPPQDYTDKIVGVTSHSPSSAPSNGGTPQPPNLSQPFYDQSYIWQFLASLALSGKLNHQRIIIDEIRDDIFGTITKAEEMGKLQSTSEQQVTVYQREKLYQDLNLFLNVMGLVARDGEITELK